MSSQREAGGSGLRQEVFRYFSAQAAASALDGYVQRAQRCPRPPVPGAGAVPDLAGHSLELSVVQRTGATVLVRGRYCAPECTDIATRYWLLAQDRDGLIVASYGTGEDGDPARPARALLRATAEALRAATSGR